MNPERWRQIEGLYHAALEREPGARQSFLEKACGDMDLRREVESLLAQQSAPGGLIDRPAYEIAADLLDSTVTQFGVGAQLGPYKVEALIGAGGMGQVFKARDTRLGRAVAIKIANEEFSARFEREARAISALNHPNICTLHDVGPNYLVMELCEGETLVARLKRGPLSLEQTEEYGAQIAGALTEAHSKGIVHRDLKPGNIMITKSGMKVLDFGLAKSTQDHTLTARNAVMGTPAYMAPEQREGKVCDTRTDIYALGLVLYEMVSGKRAEPGRPLPMDAAPPQFAHLLGRLLEEDPANRWQAASDVRHELEWILKSPASVPSPPAPRTRPRWIAAAAILVIVGLGLGWTIEHFRRPASETPLRRLDVTPPLGADLLPGPAISPDGRFLAIPAHSGGIDKLWIRPLDARTARELPGTEGVTYPFWSADSRWIGFFAAGKLKKVSVNGGMPSVVCEVGGGRGGTWNAEGAILFNSVNDGPLLRVSASGGQPVPITTVDADHKENSHRWPYFLPDGRRFLYFIRSENTGPGPGTEGVYMSSLDRPQEKTLLVHSATNAIYAPPADGSSGHLLWVRAGNLMVQALDPGRGRLAGEERSIAEMVSFVDTGSRLADISVARDGTLLYRSSSARQYQLTWVDRQGNPLGTVGPPDSYKGVQISPNGSRMTVSRMSPTGVEVMALLEADRGMATPLVNAIGGVWSPDGNRIAYTWAPGGSPNVYTRAANGAGDASRLTHSVGSQAVRDWSADGRFLLYSESANDPSNPAGQDLWVLPVNGERPPFPFLKTPFRETRGVFSPDGKWIAYTSDEPGHPEVFVQSFPAGRGKWQISNKGGDYPRWRRDGKELFFIGADGALTSVAVRPSAVAVEFGSPVALFRIRASAPGVSPPFDIGPDGSHFGPGAGWRAIGLDAHDFAQLAGRATMNQHPFTVIHNPNFVPIVSPPGLSFLTAAPPRELIPKS